MIYSSRFADLCRLTPTDARRHAGSTTNAKKHGSAHDAFIRGMGHVDSSPWRASLFGTTATVTQERSTDA
jgi:hypothetical protein